ncbi:Bax protein [Pseudoalteromonas sp. BSi20652]|nr:Bax protein [Pseudoalteromonas sp. BSi20652]
MLKTIFKLLLSVFFIWALAYPFMQSNDVDQDGQTSEQPKKVKKKEKPLHNVKLPNFSEFSDVKEKNMHFLALFVHTLKPKIKK